MKKQKITKPLQDKSLDELLKLLLELEKELNDRLHKLLKETEELAKKIKEKETN